MSRVQGFWVRDNHGGFPKFELGGTLPLVRTTVFWGLEWGPLILGMYHRHAIGASASSLNLPGCSGHVFSVCMGILLGGVSIYLHEL